MYAKIISAEKQGVKKAHNCLLRMSEDAGPIFQIILFPAQSVFHLLGDNRTQQLLNRKPSDFLCVGKSPFLHQTELTLGWMLGRTFQLKCDFSTQKCKI